MKLNKKTTSLVLSLLISLISLVSTNVLAQSQFPASPLTIDNGSAPSGPGPAFDATYWRLDTTNGPVTGSGFTLSSDFNFACSGGINGFSVDGTTFSVDCLNNRIGIGTAAPGHVLDIQTGTLTAGIRALNVTSTLAASAATQWGTQVNITSAAAGTGSQIGFYTTLNPGFTGSSGNTRAIIAENTVAGTGTWSALALQSAVTDNANIGFDGSSSASTTGTNIGAQGISFGSAVSVGGMFAGGGYTTSQTSRLNALNIGSSSISLVAKNGASATERHVGAFGLALNGDTNVGGYFGLQSGTPTLTSAALMADNGATVSNIFVARDNGTAVFTIADGASVSMTGNMSQTVTSAGAGTASNTLTNATADGVAVFTTQDGTVNAKVISYGTAYSGGGTTLGLANAGISFFTGNGAGLLGVGVGPTTSVPLVLGTNNLGRMTFAGASGHVKITTAVPSSYISGTCTNETGTGDDTHGSVTADCTAQTLIVTFNSAYGTAPFCTVTPMNAAALGTVASYVTSTTALTLTVTAAAAGTWSFQCFE